MTTNTTRFRSADYYRLVADFKGAFDEYDWLKPYYRNLPHVTDDERQKPFAYNRPFREKVDALKRELNRMALTEAGSGYRLKGYD